MKVLPFTLLVPDDKSVISEQVELPHFYPYLHRHDEFQITWIQKGEGTLVAGNNMHSFQSGDIFMIGANLPHLFKSNPEYFEVDSGKQISACSLYFNPLGKMESLFNLPETRNYKTFLQNNKHGFKIPAAHTAQIAAKLQMVHQSSGAGLLFNFLDLFDNFIAIGDAEPLCPAVYSSDISENEGIRLSNILNYIMQNYHTPITLEHVSDVAYMTPPAFCRYFKKHTGRKFISFLNEVRINEACKNLISGRKADCISGVAYNAGFNSITNFNRVFKSVTGISPKDYIFNYKKVNNTYNLSA
ncbi:AraC family transcriptional regulator [Pedobacter sp. MC2016-14]|uniref:AraC family transcriptional regulator n=1 Tax=Pedobacter sp. MC2016-14 TaxID=2897327 RepID=UPI001E3DA87B|nr:AraC family transcriptional regulator [Pedobacter sp. MC2016-14]MCD0489533.1 AraC family transcriptional regulator [Pedobacter sp. MC2016-14]